MASVPASHTDLLNKKPALGYLATVNRDGSPQVTPVWVDADGERVLVNTARGRLKARNVARDPRVALTVMDPENPYRYVVLKGRVIETTEVGADAHIDRMAKKYIGQDVYPWRAANEVRLLMTIELEKVHVTG